jgi:hypothetical protein
MKEISNSEFTYQKKLQYLYDIESGLANMEKDKLLVSHLYIVNEFVSIQEDSLESYAEKISD